MDVTGLTIPTLVQKAAELYDGDIALEVGGRRTSYGELAVVQRQAAKAFIAAGIERGDRVAIWAPNIVEWIYAAIGLQSAGGVLVPLNTRLKGAEAAYILKNSEAKILCTVSGFLDTDYADLLADAVNATSALSATGEGDGNDGPIAGLPHLRRIVMLRRFGDEQSSRVPTQAVDEFLSEGSVISDEDADRRIAAVRPDDWSDVLFTSGTTGNPKGVISTHEQNLRSFHSWSDVIGLRRGDRYLIVNPFFHAFGYKAGWLSSIMRGATILPQLVFGVPEVLRNVGEKKISVLPGPPALYQSILAHPDLEKFDISSLRLAVTGAAAIPVELIHRMRDELTFETVITGYGLTEACGIATMCRFDDDPETIATTSGRAIPDVEVQCVDTSGTEVPRGEPGEVVIRGYNVMMGYLANEAATKETIDDDGWLHTGDIGVMDERGYLRITDRIKDMFIMGGFNCYPAEIEHLLITHEDIDAAAVIGVPDERMGEVGMAFVVPSEGSQVDEDGLIAWCRDTMANYKVPRYVEVIDALPMNAMNKVTKFVLREWAEKRLGEKAAG